MSRVDPPKSAAAATLSPNAPGGRAVDWFWRVLLAVAMSVHAWLTVRLFPSWSDLVNDQPVISVDHAIHLYHGYLGSRFLSEHASSWGYDPYFMAGYPKTPVYDSSSGPAELFELLAGGQYSPRAYKIGVATVVAAVPIVIALAGFGYGMRLSSIALAVVWSVWFWWSSFADTLVRTGLVAFVWASALAALAPGLLVRWAREPSWKSWLALAFGVALGIQAHSMFPLMVALPMAVGVATIALGGVDRGAQGRRPVGWRWHGATWPALLFALLVTSFWWWPLLKFLPLKTPSDLFMKYQGNPHDPVAKRVGLFVVIYYLSSDAMIPLLLLFFGLIGIGGWCVAGRRLHAAIVASQVAGLAFLTFAGSEWQVTRNLEPLRFQVPLALSLCVVAGEGLWCVVSSLAPARIRGTTSMRVRSASGAAALGLAIALTVPALWWDWIGFNPKVRPPSSWQGTALRLRAARPLAVGLTPEMTELTDWIRQNTDASARILFEDQLRLLENLDPGAAESIHWTPLLPVLTDRQFVGGLYHLAFIPHRHAAFGDWSLAGRKIREWSPGELQEFLDQYNIGWVITWSRSSPLKQGADYLMPLSTDVFARMDSCEPVAHIRRHTKRLDENEYTVFQVRRPRSYFAKGGGRVVAADYNRIELADLVPEDGELILRYHWQAEFVADPAVPLERADARGDPVGFVRIKASGPLGAS